MTDKQVKEAKILCNDIPFGKVNIDYLTPKYGKKKVDELYKILEDKKAAFATHRYDYPEAKDVIFNIGIKEEFRDRVFYRKQYPLNEKKTLAFTYDTIKKLEAGIIERDETSPHNIPVICIDKPIKENDDTEKDETPNKMVQVILLVVIKKLKMKG